MFVLDMPNLPPQNPTIMVAKTKQVEKIRKVGVCFPAPVVDIFPPSGEQGNYVISPGFEAEQYFKQYEKKKVSGPIKSTILQMPQNGTLEKDGEISYVLRPNRGYLGSDKATIRVEPAGYKVDVVYFFRLVVGGGDSENPIDWCGNKKGSSWKIS